MNSIEFHLLERTTKGLLRECHEVEQVLGKVLGYPLMGPEVGGDNTEVCVGDHTPGTLAAEAADKIRKLRAENDSLHEMVDGINYNPSK